MKVKEPDFKKHLIENNDELCVKADVTNEFLKSNCSWKVWKKVRVLAFKSNINEYWSAFWANLEVYNSSAAWIKDLEVCSYKLSVMAVNEFSANDI